MNGNHGSHDKVNAPTGWQPLSVQQGITNLSLDRYHNAMRALGRYQTEMAYDLVVVNIYSRSGNFSQLEIANPAEVDAETTEMNAGTVNGGTKFFMEHFDQYRELANEIKHALQIFKARDSVAINPLSDRGKQRERFRRELLNIAHDWNHSLVQGEHASFELGGATISLYWFDYPASADIDSQNLRSRSWNEEWIHTPPAPGRILRHDTCFRLRLYQA